MIQATIIIGTGLGSGNFFANKFFTSINKCHPSINLEEKSKFNLSIPSDLDIDPGRLKSPKFEKNKLNVNENIKS